MHRLGLSEIVHPLTTDLFLARHFGKTMLHSPGPAQRFAPFSDCFAAGRPGQRIDEIHGAARALAERLERELDADIQVHLAADAPLRRQCERDTLVLQVRGESRWRVEDAAGQPAWGDVLAAGHALYLPRDWWWVSEAGTGPGRTSKQEGSRPGPAARGSVVPASASEPPAGQALRVTIENPTGADLVSSLLGVLENLPEMRRDVPRFGSPGEQADFVASLRRPLMRLLRSPGLIDRYNRYLRGAGVRETVPGRPWSEHLSLDYRIDLARVRRLRVRRADSRTVFLMWRGEQVSFPEDAAPLLQFVMEEAPVTIARFYEVFSQDFDRAELADFLSVLSAKGVITLRDPDERA